MKQQALKLRYRRWGGRRAGSGRKPGPNLRIRHRSRPRLARHHPCHVTLKVRRGIPSLRNVRLVRELERTFALCCDRGEFRLVHYSIQNDHVHLMVEAADRHALGRGMKSICARVARAVNRVFRRRGRVLADRYHLHILRSPREVRAALAYVLLNARKHARRLGSRRALAPASSARWLDGWKVPQPRARAAPCVATPRTWLLRVGWRRHGLLDPAAVPGAA